jgi:hypothetical protein
VGTFNEPKWQAVLRDFNNRLAPAEHHAATLLKSRIFALASRPQLLVLFAFCWCFLRLALPLL